MKAVFPGHVVEDFSGIILETGEKVYGNMFTYYVNLMNKGNGTCCKFVLPKRLKFSYYESFYTLVLEDGREYTVYMNDKYDALIQYDVSI